MTDNIIKRIADVLNFSEEEIELIIPYLLKHNPELNSAEDFIKEWDSAWYRNYDFDKDIVDYEFQYIGDYNYGGAEGTSIKTKEDLKAYLLSTYVFKLEDDNDLNSWSIYKINDNLWIEVNY